MAKIQSFFPASYGFSPVINRPLLLLPLRVPGVVRHQSDGSHLVLGVGVMC